MGGSLVAPVLMRELGVPVKCARPSLFFIVYNPIIRVFIRTVTPRKYVGGVGVGQAFGCGPETGWGREGKQKCQPITAGQMRTLAVHVSSRGGEWFHHQNSGLPPVVVRGTIT